MLVRAETATPLPSPILTRKPYNRNAATATAIKATTTNSTWWLQRRRQQPSIQSTLPPLLQRPQLPPTTIDRPKPLADDLHNDDEADHVVRRTAAANPADVLALMDSLRLPVDLDTYLSLVKECTDAMDAVQGTKVHTHIKNCTGDLLSRRDGLLLANRLLLMYAACGQIDRARQVFDEMPVRDAISWTTVIAAVSDSGRHRESMELFVDGVDGRWMGEPTGGCCFATAVTVVIRSCNQTRELAFGQQIHALIIKLPVHGKDYSELGGQLIQLYTALGHYDSARKVFDRMSLHDSASWASMITACCRDGGFNEAFYAFREMGRAGARKNPNIVSSVLPACSRMEVDGWSGKQVHSHAVKLGLGSDQTVGSSLVDMYAKSGRLGDVRQAFEVAIRSNDAGDGTRSLVAMHKKRAVVRL